MTCRLHPAKLPDTPWCGELSHSVYSDTLHRTTSLILLCTTDSTRVDTTRARGGLGHTHAIAADTQDAAAAPPLTTTAVAPYAAPTVFPSVCTSHTWDDLDTLKRAPLRTPGLGEEARDAIADVARQHTHRVLRLHLEKPPNTQMTPLFVVRIPRWPQCI